MKDEKLLERITMNPKIMVGKPVIRGTRLTVESILNRLAHGMAAEEIIEEYKALSIHDIEACRMFVSKGSDE